MLIYDGGPPTCALPTRRAAIRTRFQSDGVHFNEEGIG